MRKKLKKNEKKWSYPLNTNPELCQKEGMSLDIEQANITIQPNFQLLEPIENDWPAVLDFDKSSSFDNSLRAHPAALQALSYSDCPFHVELSTLRCEKGYWRQRHQKAVERQSEIAAILDSP